jgi:hypothetical protein
MRSEPTAFAGLVAPLERAAGKRLDGAGRRKCVEAFVDAPDGFRAVVADARRRGKVNPLGLLVRMVEAGQHRAIADAGAKFGNLEQALRWAAKTAPTLPVELRAHVLDDFGLSDVERLAVENVIAQRNAAA